MKGIFFSVAVLAIFVFAVGPKNLASIATRAFSPSGEGYRGEIPLDKMSLDKTFSDKNNGEQNQDKIQPNGDGEVGGIINYTTQSISTGTPVGVKVYTANIISKTSSEDLKLLSNKLNLLETRISEIVSILDPGAPLSSSAYSQSPQSQASSNSPTSQISPANTPNHGGIIDYTTQSSVQSATTVSKTGRILVSEIMAGADSSANYEFVELYNAGANSVDLTGWSLKKKTSTGNEGSLVAAKLFSGKVIQPGRYLLLGNASGYAGSAALDITWTSSNTLAYKKNAVALYDSDGNKTEEIYWEEIPKGQSLARIGWTGANFTISSSPTPQNSQSR